MRNLGNRLAYQDLDLDWIAWPGGIPEPFTLCRLQEIQLAGLLLGPKGNQVVMANAVEARYPFLDEDVIAFTSRLHPRWKLTRRLRDKYLLRQAARHVYA